MQNFHFLIAAHNYLTFAGFPVVFGENQASGWFEQGTLQLPRAKGD
jgi:hypothetical protein